MLSREILDKHFLWKSIWLILHIILLIVVKPIRDMDQSEIERTYMLPFVDNNQVDFIEAFILTSTDLDGCIKRFLNLCHTILWTSR